MSAMNAIYWILLCVYGQRCHLYPFGPYHDHGIQSEKIALPFRLYRSTNMFLSILWNIEQNKWRADEAIDRSI